MNQARTVAADLKLRLDGAGVNGPSVDKVGLPTDAMVEAIAAQWDGRLYAADAGQLVDIGGAIRRACEGLRRAGDVPSASMCTRCSQVVSRSICLDCADDARSDGVERAMTSFVSQNHALYVGLQDCPIDVPEAWFDKPIARFARLRDEGDPRVGIGSTEAWCLTEHQEGTILADILSLLRGRAGPVIRAATAPTFQRRVRTWLAQCFEKAAYQDSRERGDRLLEETLELLQSRGYDKTRVALLTDYVYRRPAGEPAQEVGGVMVTLAAYCATSGLDMHEAGEQELARIMAPEGMAKVRAKQALKDALTFDTPLPGGAGEAVAATSVTTSG